jgi:glutamate synthase (NADPH/NADH) small chain
VGADITFEDIRAKHDFVVIATGVYKSRDLPAPVSVRRASCARSTT